MIETYYYTIELQRKTTSGNGYGGTSETWSKLADIQGLIDWVSNKGQMIGGQWQTVLRPILMTATGQDIKQYDRVVYDGKTYDIKNVPDNVMQRGHHLEIDLEVVTGG